MLPDIDLQNGVAYSDGHIFADRGFSYFGSRKVIRYMDDSFIMARRSLRVRNVN